MLGSGAMFTASLSWCVDQSQSHSKLGASRMLLPEPRTATPAHRVAHSHLRDGAQIPPPARTIRTDDVVVGGGMSGLAASHFARQRGLHTIVVEAEKYLGGAAVSTDIDGISVPLGSAYFVSRTPEIDVLLDATKISPVICPEDEVLRPNGPSAKNNWSDSTLRTVIGDVRDREGMQRFRDDLLAMDAQYVTIEIASSAAIADQYRL